MSVLLFMYACYACMLFWDNVMCMSVRCVCGLCMRVCYVRMVCTRAHVYVCLGLMYVMLCIYVTCVCFACVYER